jgi:hypothetical protein
MSGKNPEGKKPKGGIGMKYDRKITGGKKP